MRKILIEIHVLARSTLEHLRIFLKKKKKNFISICLHLLFLKVFYLVQVQIYKDYQRVYKRRFQVGEHCHKKV